MSDADFLSPQANQTILTTHIEALSRAVRGTGVVSGNKIVPSDPVSMSLTVQAGRIRIVGAPLDTTEDSVELDAGHATLPRIDIIYRNTEGAAAIVKGAAAAIEDPKSLAAWKSYTSPIPAATVPDGAIIGAIWIPAECAVIASAQIWMFAGGIEDLTTEIVSPGSDARPPSEKAVMSALSLCAPAASGVTGGDLHDHAGGDGAQIDHGTLAGRSDDDHSQYHTDARGDLRYAQLAHAARHASAGADALKLDNLAEGDDNTDLDASITKHGLFPKFPNTKQALIGDKTWVTRTWPASFVFGDGSDTILAQEMGVGPFPLACKITGVRIREQALLSSTATITLHIHDYDAVIGDAVDSFSLSGSTYSETGLAHAVAAGKFVTVKIASPASAKQLSVGLVFEAT